MTIKELIKLINDVWYYSGSHRVVDIKYINEGEDVEITYNVGYSYCYDVDFFESVMKNTMERIKK